MLDDDTLEGTPVSSPAQCAELWTVPLFGSFSERCDLCMALLGEVSNLWQSGTRPSELETAATALCTAAAAKVTAEIVPTIRTCRLHEAACVRLVNDAREQACPSTWADLRAGAALGSVRSRQQQLCGAMMTQRNGSGVEDALVCPVPRDVGFRVMTISAVVAATVFFAQWARV